MGIPWSNDFLIPEAEPGLTVSMDEQGATPSMNAISSYVFSTASRAKLLTELTLRVFMPLGAMDFHGQPCFTTPTPFTLSAV